MSHTCPVPGCTLRVPPSKLLCLPHWRRVSPSTGRELYNAYRQQPLSERHRAAIQQAIKEASPTPEKKS